MKNLRTFGFLVVLFTLCILSVSAKDQWITVRSQNFFLIGNASEKDIRKVAMQMEQFRATFRLLFPKTALSSAKPTNIVVFKSESSYKPFLPRRKDGKADTGIAGYFQPGEDVNYITLSTEGEDEDTFKVIYHEYVHYMIDSSFGRSEIPAWLNEGLAEYYSTFKVENGNEVSIGYPILEHANFLAANGLLALGDLFNASNRDIHANGGRARHAFYAESWALVHLLMTTGRNALLSKFVAGLNNDLPPEQAFQAAFGTGYEDMEKQLRKYVSQGKFNYQILTLKEQLAVASGQTVTPIDDAQTNAYLGDLLYHSNRLEEAETYLAKALAADPKSVLANTAMGMTKVRQQKYAEAEKYLDAAVSGDANDYKALYWYATLIVRESTKGLLGSEIQPEKAKKAAELLARAIKIKPDSAESADMLAFIALVRQQGLDEALAVLKTALNAQPGNQRLALRIIDILLAKNQYDEALASAKKIAANSESEEIASRARSLVARLSSYLEQKQNFERQQQSRRDSQGREVIRTLSDEDSARMVLAARNYGITEQLTKPGADSDAAIGNIRKVTCGKGIQVSFITGGKQMRLVMKDFQGLELTTYLQNTVEFGCDADFSNLKAYVVFRKPVKPGSDPVLTSVAFLPDDFEIVDKMPGSVVETTPDVTGSKASTDDQAPKLTRKYGAAELEAIRQNLRKPGPDEIRVIGTIQKLVCTSGDPIVHFQPRSGTLLQLTVSMAVQPQITIFTRDSLPKVFDCNASGGDVPAIITYRKTADQNRPSTAGQVVSIEFVPKEITID